MFVSLSESFFSLRFKVFVPYKSSDITFFRPSLSLSFSLSWNENISFCFYSCCPIFHRFLSFHTNFFSAVAFFFCVMAIEVGQAMLKKLRPFLFLRQISFFAYNLDQIFVFITGLSLLLFQFIFVFSKTQCS